ncbi:acyltransferase family protein [Microbacterium sp. 10M-3C3]|uniref:acyltransferase family protein n=1 Tax=Microbacterium sp. 10M-3C3 TaxID=2483401 RepID=UPI000F6334A9|nr:acyltransferase family protein [Microbacterium sp. 10M-3C3]
MTTAQTSTARSTTRRDIQGLRALAVVGVILCHVLGWPTGGFAGVDVFFVISGFLITGLLLREVADTGRISLRGFYARRIRRILPAAVLVIAAVAVAGWFLFNRTRADATLWDVAAALGLVANWRFAAVGTDYFAQTDAVSPLQHFWSLSVEEQFYLMWPGLLLLMLVLLVPAAARRGARVPVVVGGIALAVSAASLAAAAAQTASEPTIAYFSTATRVWELGAGALLAALAPLLARVPRVLGGAVQWIGLAGIVWAFASLDADNPFPFPGALLPVAATALVIAGGVAGDPRQRHLLPLSNPVSVFIGDASYALYLWHFPALVFAGVLLPAGDATTAIVLAATAVLAVSTYLGWEQPLHRSPWLRRVSAKGPDAAPHGAIAAPAVPDAAPAARAELVRFEPSAPTPQRVGASRPAGWAPGQRYYPGRSPRPAASAPAASAASAPAVPAARTVSHNPRPRSAHDRTTWDMSREEWDTAAAPNPADAATPEAAPDAASAPSRSWAAWRARYAGQMALAAATLGIGAAAIVLVLQSTFGAPVMGPLTPPVADATTAPAENPTAAVQAALADAVSATSWPQLSPSLDEVIAASSAQNPAHDCFSPDVALDAGRCTWGSSAAPHHLYLVGDSTAMAYAPAFKKLAEDSGGQWRATTVGLYGCRFTDVLVQNSGAGVMEACPQRKQDVGALLAADPADLVVVSNAYTLGRGVDGRPLSATDLVQGARAEMAAFGVTGRVVYLAPPPLGGDLGACYSPVTSPANCVTAVDPTWREIEVATENVAAADGDHALSSLPFTCWDDVCPAFAGGVPLRYDQTHFTVAYAERIAPVLAWDLRAAGLL